MSSQWTKKVDIRGQYIQIPNFKALQSPAHCLIPKTLIRFCFHIQNRRRPNFRAQQCSTPVSVRGFGLCHQMGAPMTVQQADQSPTLTCCWNFFISRLQ